VRHVGAIAGRELRSLFASPVAYAVLTLFAVLAGFFFLSGVLQFQDYVVRMQAFQMIQQLEELNLNDHVIAPFFQVMSVVLLFLIPGITMGLFASEKVNGTQELLLTSPITIWELVIGKFLAAAAFVALLVLLVALFPGLLFLFGDAQAGGVPEIGKTLSGLGGLLLVGLAYAAVGAFASSVTQSQLIAFFLAFVLLLVLWMLGFLADLGAAGGAVANETVSGLLRWLSTAEHFERMVMGLVQTKDVAYFAALVLAFLIITKAAVESVRWR
jgi:ABC-2 type transport system permease protein